MKVHSPVYLKRESEMTLFFYAHKRPDLKTGTILFGSFRYSQTISTTGILIHRCQNNLKIYYKIFGNIKTYYYLYIVIKINKMSKEEYKQWLVNFKKEYPFEYSKLIDYNICESLINSTNE